MRIASKCRVSFAVGKWFWGPNKFIHGLEEAI